MSQIPLDEKILKNTIFVVDDDDDILQSLVLFFEMKGFKVQGFSSALDYLSAFDDTQGVLISDVSMPGMNGLEMLEKLNEIQQLRPILFMTGFATTDLAVKAIQLGASDFIEKPFSTKYLLSKVLNIFEKFEEVFLAFDLYKSLTKREVHVFELVVKNLTNQKIAEKLFISISTVEKHRATLMIKMKVGNLNELMQKSLQIKKIFNYS